MSVRDLLEENDRKDLLRLLTAGSVDDGKSTLIGRLLFDSKTVYEDHLSSLEKDSRRMGSAGGETDYSLLLDGLEAEREQGITIDVAYRYFSTPKRKFIIADTPGHVQYTRNMATGASTASLAILLVDARHGVVEQTRRHAFIASLLGIRHLLVAVNKMDLVDFEERAFEDIRQEFSDFAARLEVRDVHFIPISALCGDNVVERSERTPWFEGASLLHHLETVHIASDRNLIDLRFPVQYVLRQSDDFRGFCGTISSGVLRNQDEVLVLPSGRSTRVDRIVTYDGDLEEAYPPMAVTVTLQDEIDVSRGDVLVHPGNIPRSDTDLEAMLVWLSPDPLRLDGQYLVKTGTTSVRSEITDLRYRTNVRTLRREQTESLELNEIGRVRLRTSLPLHYDSYSRNRASGSFILIDPLSNATVAAGMLVARRAHGAEDDESKEVQSTISGEERLERLGQTPLTLLLRGSEEEVRKQMVCDLERRLFDMGHHAQVIFRRDLGIPSREAGKYLQWAVRVAALNHRHGWISLVDVEAPLESDLRDVYLPLGVENWFEVFVKAEESPEAPAGSEAPESYSIRVTPGGDGVERILELLRERGVIPA